MKKVPVVNNLEEFQLSDDVAGGSKLPYSGYVEVEIQIPFIQRATINCISSLPATETTPGLNPDSDLYLIELLT
jgi:hypothetical protein